MKKYWFSLLALPVLFLTACAPDRRSDIPVASSSLGSPASVHSSDEDVAATQLHVRDFGAVPSSDNIFQALEDVVAAAKAADGLVEILFEPDAVYRIGLPDRKDLQSQYAWHIKNATNLVINGQGATLLVTQPEPGAICTENCRNIAVKNFKVDYDPLPYAQGTVTAINLDEYWFELKVDEDSMEPDQPCFDRAMSKWGLTVRDASDGGRIYGPTAVFSNHWKKTGDRIWRFFPPQKGGGYADPLNASGLKPGDRFIHMARNYAQAVAAKNCDELLWENITILASPGLAFYPRGTSHHTIRDCHVAVKAGRIFSTNADGIHMRGSRGHVLIEGCSFEGMADDAINVHSSAMSVQEVPAPNQVRVKKHTFSVRPGDELMMIHPENAAVLGTNTVVSVEDRGSGWLITFKHDLPKLSIGTGFESSDNLYNLSESADPFIIRNCTFGDYRGRGILVSAHGGLIENNTFKVREGWSVVMNYESSRWAEGPIAYDIAICDNDFYGHTPGQPAIYSVIHTRNGAAVSGAPFRNIRIEDNRFFGYPSPAVRMMYASDLQMLNNREISKRVR